MIVAVPITITRLVVVALACAAVPVLCGAAEPESAPVEPVAADYVAPFVDKKCDDINSSWLVANKHTHLSIQVTLQWQPVGGKPKEETIVLAPQQRRPVGCAPTIQIVSAQLMQF